MNDNNIKLNSFSINNNNNININKNYNNDLSSIEKDKVKNK
jgi:hypothetical protein